jgi:hypothetical protein
MNRFITDSQPPQAVALEFDLPNDVLCDHGYEPLDGRGVVLGEQLQGQPKRAMRGLPQGCTDVPDSQGIYRIEIQLPDHGVPPGSSYEVYVGKATSLRSRFADYAEMTRRLLGLYHAHPMATDGNRFRYVHYRIASAIVDCRRVVFWYIQAPDANTPQALARLELLEIAHTTMSFHTPGAPTAHDRVLNAYDGLRSSSHGGLSGRWQEVRSLLA